MEKMIQAYLLTHQGRLKASTLKDYRSILFCHVAPFKDPENLNQGIEDYLSGIKISGKRRNNILTTVKSFLRWAKRKNLWDGEMVIVPRFPARSKRIRPLTPEDVQTVMTWAYRPYRDFFEVAFLTGLRTGELLGLQFQDFNLEENLIRITRTLYNGMIDSPKSVASEREIPLTRPVREIYHMRLRENEEESPWFFYSFKGGVISRQTLRRKWTAILGVFGIEHRPMYATRHTYASLSLAAGEDPLWVAEMMGHSRPDQLFLKYASFIKGLKDDGQKLAELLYRHGTKLSVAP